jgi:hypothetical protein
LNTPTTRISNYRAATIIAVALFAMAVIAPFAILGCIDDVVSGAAPASGVAFRWAVMGVAVIALLDLVVGWAVWRLFKPLNGYLAGLSGGIRVGYGVIYLIAIAFLATGTPSGIDTYQRIWSLALGVFGIHLALLGVLCGRSAVVPRWIGGLVGLAGMAYAADAVGTVASSSYHLSLAAYLFVGEPVLMVWLGWWSWLGRSGRGGFFRRS